MNDPNRLNWLHSALGKDGAPEPPALDSGRAKDLIARALMYPGSLTPQEIQELAASALSHLIMLKRA